ncbi:hypothetical protein KKC44_06620, partial [Patescibacteria group bacterium]|nr:hypothetical protein [Patescibacteria group bacterium]
MNFFIRYKKLLLIIGFIVIVFALGYFLYALFFKAPPPPSDISEPAATTTPAGLPVSPTGPGQIISPIDGGKLPIEPGGDSGIKASPLAQGGLTQTTELSQVPSLGAALDKSGSDLQYYDRLDGKFYKITKKGEVSTLTEKVFHNVSKLIWSPNKNKAILEYPDGANIIYDFEANKQISLPKHWEDFDFSPDGGQIVMKSLGFDPGNRWLTISNDDGSKAIAIEALGENEATVYPSWSPNNQSIAMYAKGVSFDRQEVFFIGLNDENFKSTIVEGRGFQHKWAPNGDQLLYSVYSSDNDLKPSLWVVNAQGDSIGSGRKSLKLDTWAEKCTFANETDLFCAVPKELDEGAGLFPELAKNTPDRLYKIDTKTGLKQLIAIPD